MCSSDLYGNSGATTTSSASDTYFNPVSYYYLDGNVNDALGVNNGTNNGATSTTGKIGGAYSFDGTSYIQFAPWTSGTGYSFTATTWIYPTSTGTRSEEHTSELQSHSFISYAVFCLKKKKKHILFYSSFFL